MTLRDMLNEILPRLLPTDPHKAVNGTELLEQVRPELQGEYSPNTIMQHFSVMSADTTSPIAKVAQGQGYYLRSQPQGPAITDTINTVEQQGQIVTEINNRAGQREEKFRSLFIKYAELGNRFPARIEHTRAIRQIAGVNKWKFPDVVILDWDVGRVSDEGYQIDRELLEVKKSLGEQPFRLTSAELKAELKLSSFRENFFQCVSNSKWAHHAHFVCATTVQDDMLARELRRLGTSFGVSILSYGPSVDDLDRLPDANDISNLPEVEIERLTAKRSISTIASAGSREALDWEHIEDIRTQSSDFNEVFAWISKCLRDGRPYPLTNYQEIAENERERAELMRPYVR